MQKNILLPVISAALITSCGTNSATEKEAPRLPNVVLIMADDMGFECLGVYGSESYHAYP